MQQPFWKYIASYFYEFRIEAIKGEYNPYLEVVYSKGRYRLDTENAIYSYENLYTNFSNSFRQIKLNNQDIETVLVLGLGLGSIPVMLEQDFRQKYRYTAVEIDEEVLHLAYKYALKSLKSPIQVIHGDAELFTRQCNEKFDLICMDVFLDDAIPSEFERSNFLHHLKNIITPNGLLMYNRLANTKKDKITTQYFFKKTFCEVFPDATYLDVDGNWMLLNRKV